MSSTIEVGSFKITQLESGEIEIYQHDDERKTMSAWEFGQVMWYAFGLIDAGSIIKSKGGE